MIRNERHPHRTAAARELASGGPRLRWLGAPVLAVALVAACGTEPEDAATGPAASEPAPPAPAPQAEIELPPGHPTLTAPGDELTVSPPPPGTGMGAAALVWEAPEGWIAETPSSAMRKAQYRIPGSVGDAECVVFYFGPGQGGDARANAERWAQQFRQPDGRSPLEALETEEIEVDGIEVLMVEVSGTYGGGMPGMGAQGLDLPDHMLLGAVAQGADANWFFKLTGPSATVREQKSAFEQMIRSLSPGA